MKIEKISENQIRCTLSHQDLVDRELKISELAYGTEKAKALFRDMMQQASYEFGFEAEDIPIMIEAIPISRETLILIITKVEDPDELDTRFSKFSSEKNDGEEYYDDAEDFTEQLLDRFNELSGIIEDSEDENTDAESSAHTDSEDEKLSLSDLLKYPDKNKNAADNSNSGKLVKIFSFDSLNNVTRFAANVSNIYDGKNSVYKNPVNSAYYLVMKNTCLTPEEFACVCNLASEFGHAERTTYATAFHYNEHLEPIIKNNALQILGNL
ncbi:MAG: adaptor protein MecA [Lachnospiraceae bacterium]|nr:adaptor protein MecA [Lachnospiraceae bacterium]